MNKGKILRKVIFVAVVLLIIVGALIGGIRVVMNKANRISYECIGIG